LRSDDLFERDASYDDNLIVSLLRDAARQVPELADLAAPIIHEDAPLIDADIQIQWCRGQLAALSHRYPHKSGHGHLLGERERAEIQKQLSRGLNRVASAEPKTPRGVAIKALHAEAWS
jgi:hypothetical protein